MDVANFGLSQPAEEVDWEDRETCQADVAEYPQFGYSNRDVKRVGEIIAGNVPWTDEADFYDLGGLSYRQ